MHDIDGYPDPRERAEFGRLRLYGSDLAIPLRLLAYLDEACDDGSVELTRGEVAASLGCSRYAAGRAIKQLSDEGAIRSEPVFDKRCGRTGTRISLTDRGGRAAAFLCENSTRA